MARSLPPSAVCPRSRDARLHRLVDRLAGAAESERLDLYLALLLGLIERLIRFTATGAGRNCRGAEACRAAPFARQSRPWAEAWEAISEAKAEAQALNLDRGLLLLESWFRLQQVAREHPV